MPDWPGCVPEHRYGAHELYVDGACRDGRHLHEAVVWSASYRGEIAGKAVKLELWRLGGAVGGSYCYEPCNRPGATLDLEGSASGQLTETPMAGASDPRPSGRWSLAACRAWRRRVCRASGSPWTAKGAGRSSLLRQPRLFPMRCITSCAC
jgi:hypothetical protein